jgi:hypothetical protein
MSHILQDILEHFQWLQTATGNSMQHDCDMTASFSAIRGSFPTGGLAWVSVGHYMRPSGFGRALLSDVPAAKLRATPEALV